MKLFESGYYHFKQDSKQNLVDIRKHILDKFGKETRVYGSDSVLKDNLIVDEINSFKKRIEKRLNKKIYLSYDLQLHINRRDNINKGGWHIDGAQEINMLNMNNQYVFNRDYQLFKVGIYLQSNFGRDSGIDLKPSTIWVTRFFNNIFKTFIFTFSSKF
jgi:hypothetical protein